MIRKKYLILLIGIVILLNMIVVFHFFGPRQIVEDISGSQVIRIQYNPYLNQEADARIDITNYEEKKILTCLSRYTEQRILGSAASGYWIGDVQLEVIINTENGLKSILLGTDNYSYESYGKPKFRIRDADSLKAKLLAMMDIDAMG